MSIRKVVVTGAGGMLGKELVPFLQAKGYDVMGLTSRDCNLLGTQAAITETLQALEPQVILHAAAFTNVDAAESNADLAMAVNKDGTHKLALAAQACDAILAMVSTDYVFDGAADRPYRVTDRPNPTGQYGLSKYYGELMVREVLDTYYIIRTSWLYGIHRQNFVQFVLDSARQGSVVQAMTDQIGSPTWTGTLCHLIEGIITSGAYGVYHAADRGAVSRYEQACRVCEAAGFSTQHIRPVLSRDFPQAARRPAYSPLDPGELVAPHWETAFQAYLTQYLAALS